MTDVASTSGQATTARVLAVVGPTASGKSALALEVARRTGAEIVSADSMQAYRGMRIGTAAPTAAERAEVPHHLVDSWPIDRALTVMEFQAAARQSIADIHARGRPVIVVGGSGLHVRAVLDDLRFPPTQDAVRGELESQLREFGPAAMHERLMRIDPEAAGVIDVANGRRIIRALEVNQLTGGPFRARLPKGGSVIPAVRLGLAIDRTTLDARIADRVDGMWAEGFVAEVRALRDAGLDRAPTASRALGYAQILAHLDGVLTQEQARDETVTATRRFARRQQRWFARDERITWLRFDRSDLVDQAAAMLESGTLT